MKVPSVIVLKEYVKPKSRQPVVQDLVPCPKCGAYVAAGTACSCEKA